MATRRKGKTVAEFEAELRVSGKYEEFLAVRREKDAEHQKKVQEHHRLLAPLLEDLRRVGVPSLRAILVGNRAKAPPYPSALPVLIDHLQRPYAPEQLCTIASGLGVPQARVWWVLLVAQYERQEDHRVRDTLANVLEAVLDESVLDEYIGIVRNPANGSSRVLLLWGLVRLKVPRGIAALREVEFPRFR